MYVEALHPTALAKANRLVQKARALNFGIMYLAIQTKPSHSMRQVPPVPVSCCAKVVMGAV